MVDNDISRNVYLLGKGGEVDPFEFWAQYLHAEMVKAEKEEDEKKYDYDSDEWFDIVMDDLAMGGDASDFLTEDCLLVFSENDTDYSLENLDLDSLLDSELGIGGDCIFYVCEDPDNESKNTKYIVEDVESFLKKYIGKNYKITQAVAA